MGYRIPLHGSQSTDDLVRHRQHMIQMARVIDPERGLVAGFRPQYMEHVLVNAGHADPALLRKTQSTRSAEKAKGRATFVRKFKENRRNGSPARAH